jgi:hypothetical protein
MVHFCTQKPILMLCTSEIRHILPSPSGFGEVIGSPICWDPSWRCLEVDPEVAWRAGGAFGGRGNCFSIEMQMNWWTSGDFTGVL